MLGCGVWLFPTSPMTVVVLSLSTIMGHRAITKWEEIEDVLDDLDVRRKSPQWPFISVTNDKAVWVPYGPRASRRVFGSAVAQQGCR